MWRGRRGRRHLRCLSPPPCIRARTGYCKAAPPPAGVSTPATPSTPWRGASGSMPPVGGSLPLLVSVLEQVLASVGRALVLRTGAHWPRQRYRCGQSACWLRTLVLRTGAPLAQAEISLWAVSLLAANPCPADGRSTGPGRDVGWGGHGRPKTPRRQRSRTPRPKSAPPKASGRVPHRSWPSGPFEHGDKEPCRGGEAAPKGDAPLHIVEGVAQVETWAGGGEPQPHSGAMTAACAGVPTRSSRSSGTT
jgi:hypothetical protein